MEVQLTGDGINIAASEVSEDMYASIDLVLDKLEAQVKKFVSRNKEIHRKGRANDIDVYTFEVTEEDGERTITGRDHFSPKPMSPDEAAMQLDANDFEFLTFLNSENDRINVIYRRKNGNLGLIESHLLGLVPVHKAISTSPSGESPPDGLPVTTENTMTDQPLLPEHAAEKSTDSASESPKTECG